MSVNINGQYFFGFDDLDISGDFEGLTVSELATGFSIAGGTSSEKTLTVSETVTLDQDLQLLATPRFDKLRLGADISVTESTWADGLVVEKNDNTGISILTPTNKVGSLFFGDSGNSLAGYLQYSHVSDQFNFGANGATKFVVASLKVVSEKQFFIKEMAVAADDAAGYGQLWVKNTTPCQLWFTDDTGADTQIV